jgi:DNA-binding CsgD family transcriptional regulator
MGKQPVQGELFAPSPTSDVLPINERCLVRLAGRHRVVVVCGFPIAQFALDDHVAQAYAMINLVEQGWADQNDVARAFGCSTRTLRRHQTRFAEGGLVALGRPRGYPQGRSRLPRRRKRQILRLKEQGHSNRTIAQQVGISEMAIRKLLKRWDWKPTEIVQPDLFVETEASKANAASLQSANPKLSAFSCDEEEPVPFTSDRDPLDRLVDRLLARLGLLDDAAPLFCSGHVPRAGVLLAVPSLVRSGIFQVAREIYGHIGPAFYGLRTSLIALLLLALLRIKRPEALKEHPPGELGRLLGLDRAPEVKTLRRKLARLAAVGRAAELGRALAARRVEARGAAVGVLYTDGHVRVYHGLHRLPKAHVAQMRLSLPATTDYWVNDRAGDPLFVVTAQANAGLVRMLPLILRQVRALVGPRRRVTIVFDRGGWSPRLFRKILEQGFDLLTYRKGRCPRVPRRYFRPQRGRIEGRCVEYVLADQEIRLLQGSLRLRQVTRLSEDDSHQTPVVTSRRDWRAIEVAYRMFERWRQENFFKYLAEEYALDVLVEYGVEPDDPEREVPNPAWAKIDAKCREVVAEARDLTAAYGLEAMLNPETARPTMRGFKIAHAAAARKVQKLLRTYVKLRARRKATPRRIAVSKTTNEPIVKLSVERKHLTNVLKMVAYQAESDLVKLVSPHYRRADQEGRTLIQSALASAATLEVTKEALHVHLDPMSSPHRTRAIAELCAQLNRAPVIFPGTKLRLVFTVADHPG